VTPQKRAALKRRLEALRAEATGKRPVRIEPNRRDAMDVGVTDEDAQALSEMLQAIGSQRNKGHVELLGRIARALSKLADEPEEFGTCEECGDEIAPRRLELMPYATLCTECQGARDPKRGTTRKKLTDYT
jgi:DnaK suppressor protein